MTEIETFMVYELDDSGERRELNITQDQIEDILNPEQVLVIVREDLRRIFIWKGGKSPVRKRFISSRVAQTLQEELRKDSRYHRCKIVSVDAGDEPVEFLDAFQLESMEVTERLPDMRYVRNVERDKISNTRIHAKDRKQSKEEYFIPALQNTSEEVVMSSITNSGSKANIRTQHQKHQMITPSISLSKEKKEKIKEKILRIEVPENLKRLNLILGHTLFAAISKSANVFGEDIEETDWEPVKKIPRDMMELDNHVLRVYFDEKKGIVEAIEVLKKLGEQITESATRKGLDTNKNKSMTPIPPKPSLMKTKATSVKENTEGKDTKVKSNTRRQLPKIPSKGD